MTTTHKVLLLLSLGLFLASDTLAVQATCANSAPVCIASDQPAQPISGTVTCTQSTATSLRVAGGDASGTPTAGTSLAIQGSSGMKPVEILYSTAGLSVGTFRQDLDEVLGVGLSTGTGPSGAGIMRVTVANDSTLGLIAGTQAIGHLDSTATVDTDANNNTVIAVSSSAGGSTVLSAHTGRRAALVTNVDTATLYCDLGAIPTTTSYGFILKADSVGGATPKGDGGTMPVSQWSGAITCIAASDTGHAAAVAQ